jgi:hypothetical protein
VPISVQEAKETCRGLYQHVTPCLDEPRPVRFRGCAELLVERHTRVFLADQCVQAFCQQVSELFLASPVWRGEGVVLSLLGLAYLGQAACGSLLRKEEPVLVVYVRKERQGQAIAMNT